MQTSVTVALAGNPNSGKTTLFNNLTGSRQHVGNYPGITVEQKEGCRLHKGQGIRFVDLPGTYSLSAYSVEELVKGQLYTRFCSGASDYDGIPADIIEAGSSAGKLRTRGLLF